MKAMRATLLAVITILCVGSQSWAGQAPISVSHKVTGYTQQGGYGTTEYALHVVNIGIGVLEEVSLALVPQPPRIMERTSVKVGTLAPGESADLQLQVKSASKHDDRGKVPQPLWWQGKALDPDGSAIEFPVKSRPEVSHD